MIIGITHLLHCPCLILLPFFINNHKFNILYIEYFFSIMFIYTFTNGECPISYIYKKQKDPSYIAGSNISHYPEISDLFLFSRENHISIYFEMNTYMYLISLIYVINRSDIPFTMFIIPTNSILLYFAFIYLSPNHPLFYIIQNTNKTIMFLFILFLIRRDIYI
jgi:hypothetical protein